MSDCPQHNWRAQNPCPVCNPAPSVGSEYQKREEIYWLGAIFAELKEIKLIILSMTDRDISG